MPVCRRFCNRLYNYLRCQANIIVVNEHYPAECIQFQMLVNPNQRLYQVQGYDERSAPEPIESTVCSSTNSLPLKPEKRTINQPSHTPARTEASEQSSNKQISATKIIERLPTKSTLEPSAKSLDRPPDALDKAIEEMLKVKDLVS